MTRSVPILILALLTSLAPAADGLQIAREDGDPAVAWQVEPPELQRMTGGYVLLRRAAAEDEFGHRWTRERSYQLRRDPDGSYLVFDRITTTRDDDPARVIERLGTWTKADGRWRLIGDVLHHHADGSTTDRSLRSESIDLPVVDPDDEPGLAELAAGAMPPVLR